MNNQILRTPESAFKHLVDYPFSANYLEIDGMQMHYIDEGKDSDKTIFLLHGQPSWSYLYRHMIPPLVRTGYRVIAPDLIGFGKSDKPIANDAHTYANHVQWMTSFVQELNINNAAAFMQDWGGLIGLRVLANEPKWLSRLILSNTVLPEAHGLQQWLMPKMMKLTTRLAGQPTVEDFARKQSFGNWSGYFKTAAKLELSKLMQILTVRKLSEDELNAYDVPFPDDRYYAGPRAMPQIIASQLTENNAAWRDVLEQWPHPVLTLFSDKDPFLAKTPYNKQMQERFKGAHGQPHQIIKNASHFVQEDKGEQLIERISDWLKQTNF